MNKCKKCNKKKDLIHFSKMKSSITGYSSLCKACIKHINKPRNTKVVYVYRNADTKEVFYVGMGSKERAFNDKKGARNYRWWQYCKENNYEIEIINEDLTTNQAWEIEKELIKAFGRNGIDKEGQLTNIHEGGHISKSKKKVRQYDLNGFFIKEWESINNAEVWIQSIGVKSRGVTVCCQYKQKSLGGYQWFYTDEVGDLNFVGAINRESFYSSQGGNNTSKQKVIDLKTKKEYKSKRAAEKATGIHRMNKKFKERFKEIIDD